jgi:hypothetical protein
MNLNDFTANVFCETDGFMKKFFPKRTLRQIGRSPQAADSEVLAMEIVGESITFATDKDIFEFFKNFYGRYLPRLDCRVRCARQAPNLWALKR